MSHITSTDITAFLVGKQVDMFDKDNEKYFKFLVEAKVPRKILNDGYRWLVRTKEIIPIEESEDKAKIWEDAKMFSDCKLSRQETIEYAKAIYTIKSI
jgi:hypothetical protein